MIDYVIFKSLICEFWLYYLRYFKIEIDLFMGKTINK